MAKTRKRATRTKRSNKVRGQRGGVPGALATYVPPAGSPSFSTNSVGAFNKPAANMSALPQGLTGTSDSIEPWNETVNWDDIPPIDPVAGLAASGLAAAGLAKYKRRRRPLEYEPRPRPLDIPPIDPVTGLAPTDRRLSYFNLPTLVNVDGNKRPSIFGLGSTGISRRNTKSKKKTSNKTKKTTKRVQKRVRS